MRSGGVGVGHRSAVRLDVYPKLAAPLINGRIGNTQVKWSPGDKMRLTPASFKRINQHRPDVLSELEFQLFLKNG